MRSSVKVSIREQLLWVTEPEVRQYCGPMFFTTSLQKAIGNVSANGSFGLVDTGERKLLVTCHHVWDTFQTEREQKPESKICLCLDQGPPIVFQPKAPIDADRRLDLATFDMEPYLAACSGRKFFSIRNRPPSKVKAGDKIYFIGFPGYLRVETDEYIKFGRSPFALGVSSVDGFRFHLNAERIETQGDRFRGISGCPCFLFKLNRAIELVGFAIELNFDHIRCTHSICLKPDGTLDKETA